MEYVGQEHEEAEAASSSEEEEIKKDWDIESVASTYTNTDNRPKVLAEDVPRERKKLKASGREDTSAAQGEAGRKRSGSKASEERTSKSLKEMTKEEKAAYKKDVKAKQKERRAIKKKMKAVFKVCN